MILFICNVCIKASKIVTGSVPGLIDIKKSAHNQCPGGTWCDCQHRVKVYK